MEGAREVVVDRVKAIERREVLVPAAGVVLEGSLTLPVGATGLVLFAHGSGSGRKSPRNRFVADRLDEAGLGTLLLDLLTADEGAYDEYTARLRFDIGLLAGRVEAAIDWARRDPLTCALGVGLFGASTGAAAALLANRTEEVGAIVSRGGRPDLAGAEALRRVKAPTLLIVGSRDSEVLQLNRRAADELRCEKELRVVLGASHLFEEPGALDEVAQLAVAWFQRHLRRAPGAASGPEGAAP
jgi:dienelactone hydrolase